MKCPGQDSRNWKPGDIFEMACPKCGKPLEFFKDEPLRRCKSCNEGRGGGGVTAPASPASSGRGDTSRK